MNIENRSELIAFAGQRLKAAPAHKQITGIYAGVTLALTVLFCLADYLLQLQISQTGGLRGMGSRAVLSAVQTVLSYLHKGISMCLNLGYLSAMLRIARGQYASRQSLRLGFDRFWPLLRLTILLTLIYMAIGLGSVYLSTILYLLTPLSQSLVSVLMPLLSESAALDPAALLEGAAYEQIVAAMTPLFIISGVVFLAACIPVVYCYRMAEYVLIDRPGQGALAAMKESSQLTRFRRWQLFRLDLRLWWYYAAAGLVSVIAYGDQILPMLGLTLSWSAQTGYYVFYGLSAVAQFFLILFLRSRVEVVRSLAYDSLRPKEQPGNGVVLGNIFQI